MLKFNNKKNHKKMHPFLLILVILQGFAINFAVIDSPNLNLINYSSENPISYSSPSLSGTNASQDVVDYFRQLFQNDWARGEIYDPSEDGTRRRQSDYRDGSGYERFSKQDITGAMTITPILSPNNSEVEIINLINRATISLKIEQMYFYPDLTNIIISIINAENHGVDCQVILDDSNSASDETANTLTEAGVEVKVSSGLVPIYFDTMHNKGIIIDSEIVLISSINWSPTSLRENREAGLIIENAEVASYYESLFDHDWDVCLDYDPDNSFGDYLSPESINDEKKPVSAANCEYIEPETFSGEMSVTVISSPDNCFDVVADVLSGAQSSIYISVYTLSQPYLLDILADRIAHGVQVMLLLEKYQVGSYEKSYNRGTLYNLTQWGVPSISNPSVNLTAQGLWADTTFYFQHCKYAIIDNETLILSSGNWSRSSCPKPQDDGDVDGNRDWWIVIYGTDPEDLPPINTDNNRFLSGYPISFIMCFAILGIIGYISKNKIGKKKMTVVL